MTAADADRIERAVLARVDGLGVDYDAIWIDPAFANTALFCERYGYTLAGSGNCIVVAAKTGERRYCACVVQATRQLDVNRSVRRLLGARKASFASPEETVAVTGMLPDGVTPFGLPDGVPVYVDAAIMRLDRVIVGGGSRALKLSVPPAALSRLPDAEVVDGLAKLAAG